MKFSPGEFQLKNERQIGFRKTETMPNYHASDVDAGLLMKLVASSPVKRQIALESHMGNSSNACYSYNQDQRSNLNMENLVNGKASAVSHSLPRALGHELGATANFSLDPASYFTSGNKLNITGAQYENALFSSSLSELFCRKLRLSSNNSLNDHSLATAASLYEVYEPFESLEEVEAQTIGNLLPGDDDLLPGVTDGVEYMAQPHNGDDIEDFDVFSSVGGMDMGDDGLTFGQSNLNISGGNCTRNVGGLDGGGLPFGEHPSRTLFVRNINSSIEDYELRSHFEKFGDIRTLYTACKHRGFIMISYYDIRAAMNAMEALQNEPLMQLKLDISFTIPKDNSSGKHVNQGTIVVFNLDSSVSNDELRKCFGVYGEIKEIRETPLRRYHKFIEFYDVRAAEAALCAMNRSGIAGKWLKVEASCCFGGAMGFVQPNSSELDQDDFSLSFKTSPSSSDPSGVSGLFSQGGLASSTGNGKICGFHPASEDSGFVQRSFNHVISSSVPKSFPSLLRMGSVGHQSDISDTGCLQSEMKFDLQSVPSFHPHSLSDFHGRLGTGISCGSRSQISPASLPSGIIENQQFLRVSSSGASIELNEGGFPPPGKVSCSPAGRQYMWSNMQHPQPQGMIWPNSPSFVDGFSTHPQQMHAVPRAPNDMLNAVLPMRRHHVGSAPPVNSSLWDRQQHAYSGESPDASVFNPGSHGNIRISGNSTHPLEFVSHNIFPGGRERYMHLKVPAENIQCGLHHQRCMMFPAGGQVNPVLNDFGSPTERTRNHRSESASNQADNKKQFELDIDRIVRGDDKRTTLMIKNIPNKYTSKTLLAAIDEQHRGTYDFIYLPIDFKNNCNMGYAFINMINPSLIIPFYQAFNGKKWEKFNSKKVATLAYARIQGKASLISHFQNSSLMNEDKRCRPILFHTNGPNACDQVPFPMGINVRPRWVRSRASAREDNREESAQNSV